MTGLNVDQFQCIKKADHPDFAKAKKNEKAVIENATVSWKI